MSLVQAHESDVLEKAFQGCDPLVSAIFLLDCLLFTVYTELADFTDEFRLESDVFLTCLCRAWHIFGK